MGVEGGGEGALGSTSLFAWLHKDSGFRAAFVCHGLTFQWGISCLLVCYRSLKLHLNISEE